MRLDDHPTVIKVRRDPAPFPPPTQLEAQWLGQVVLNDGSDDAGLVEIGCPELAEERQFVVAISPAAPTLISFGSRMNREPVHSPARSLANVEVRHASDRVNEIARRMVAELRSPGVRAANPAMGFSMEIARPREALGALRSNRDYGDIFPQIAGMLMSGLGLSVFGVTRAHTAQLYPANLSMRVHLMVCIVVFYEAAADPLFFVLIAIVGQGFALTLTAQLVGRNILATASTGPSTKPAQR